MLREEAADRLARTVAQLRAVREGRDVVVELTEQVGGDAQQRFLEEAAGPLLEKLRAAAG